MSHNGDHGITFREFFVRRVLRAASSSLFRLVGLSARDCQTSHLVQIDIVAPFKRVLVCSWHTP
jgi:hypothetical protein